MGIGGGTVGVPGMTLFGVPIHRAVGTASAFGAIISIPGTIGAMIAGWHAAHLPPYSLGYVNLLGFILIAPASYFVAPFGAQIAHMARIVQESLRMLFALSSSRSPPRGCCTMRWGCIGLSGAGQVGSCTSAIAEAP